MIITIYPGDSLEKHEYEVQCKLYQYDDPNPLITRLDILSLTINEIVTEVTSYLQRYNVITNETHISYIIGQLVVYRSHVFLGDDKKYYGIFLLFKSYDVPSFTEDIE